MHRSLQCFAAFGIGLTAACTDVAGPLTSAEGPDLSQGRAVGQVISVMTRNLYIGFDADAAIGALATGDPAIYGPVLQASIATLQQTDVATRAETVADEIARARPHAVGLQEAYEIHADLTALGIPLSIDLDFLATLTAALAARHLPYVVAGKVLNTDIQPLPGIHLLDHEVLLIDRTKVKLDGAVLARTFQANVGPIAPGIDKRAGYIVVPVKVASVRATLVTTHLESDLGPGSYPLLSQLRAAQAAEIATVVAGAERVVVVGDLNDDPGSLMYQVFQGAGYVDTWAVLHPADPGLTAGCFGPALADPAPACQRRIDFVFERGFSGAEGPRGEAFLVGLEAWERRLGPAGMIWPSDHAGIVALLWR